MYFFLYFSNFLLLVATIVAFITHNKYKNTPLKWIPYLLTYAFVTEIIAFYLGSNGIYNGWVYNLYVNAEYLFYGYVFYRFIKGEKWKRIILFSGIIYEAYFLISYLFLSDSWYTLQTYPFAVGQILMIIFIFTFIIQILSSNKILNIQDYLIFWIALGLLFYFIIPLPLNVGKTILIENKIPRKITRVLYLTQYFGNYLLYTSFIYGFIWHSKTYKSS